MKRRFAVGAALVSALVCGVVAVPGSAGVASAKGKKSEHDRIVEFWTPARVAKATPRDFDYDPATKSFKPAKAPRAPKAPSGTVSGASWVGGGEVAVNTGKVLFAQGTSYYVCSASVVDDTVADRSIILTAAHCAYDETNRAFSTNWMFIPDYDANPVSLTTSGSFCALTNKGCWTASALVVSNFYATAGGFNNTAVVHDYSLDGSVWQTTAAPMQVLDIDFLDGRFIGTGNIATMISSADGIVWEPMPASAVTAYSIRSIAHGNGAVVCAGDLSLYRAPLPTRDHWPATPVLLAPEKVEFFGEAGHEYRLWESDDLSDWRSVSDWRAGQEKELIWNAPQSGAPSRFWRVERR